MKNHDEKNDRQNSGEQEISALYRQMKHEQPANELDTRILHLARNKELLTQKTAGKPLTLMDRIKSGRGPLAMAASVVLVGSIVLLQDWRQEVLPKRYGPQDSALSDQVAPPAPQSSQTSQPGQDLQVQQESAITEAEEVFDARSLVKEMPQDAKQQLQSTLTLDDKPLKKQVNSQNMSRYRAQPEVERLLPAKNTELDKAKFKEKFGRVLPADKKSARAGSGKDARAKISEVQAFPSPDLILKATPETSHNISGEKAGNGENSNQAQAGMQATSLTFSSQPATRDAQMESQKITAWLAEIDQLLETGEQAKAISRLKAFAASYPDHPLTDKYQKLLSRVEEP